MGKNPDLSPTKRARIVEMRNQKIKFKDIANEMQASETACKQAFYHWKKYGNFNSSPKSGRPRITSTRLDRSICRSSEIDRMKTAVEITSELKKFQGQELSVHTVRRRLRESGLNARVARRVPLISLKNRKSRLSFAKQFSNLTPDNWEKFFLVMNPNSI